MNTKRNVVNIDAEVYEKVIEHCKANGFIIRHWVERAIENWLQHQDATKQTARAITYTDVDGQIRVKPFNPKRKGKE